MTTAPKTSKLAVTAARGGHCGCSDLLEHESKTCPECGLLKPLTEYYPHGKYRASKCKLCHNAESKTWAKANPAKVREIKKRCWKTRPKRFAEARRYRLKNPVSVRKAKQAAYRKNREHYLNKSSEYQAQNVRALAPRYVRQIILRTTPAGPALKAADIPDNLVQIKTKILKIKRYDKRK